jgi:outer membrane receptor protein involved in Fe transport
VRRLLLGGVSLSGALVAAQTVYAQDETSRSEAQATADEGDIIVTGSRIARRDFVANTPITTVQQDVLQNTGSFAMETKLLQLPQFAGTTNSQFSTGYFNSGAATLNLRNLGENRNLVLLDGRRMQPATRETLAIDVNAIPSALIDNVEIISGGASAVYGADAVSGVVNFKLKRNFEGVALDAYAGINERGQNRLFDASAMIGGNFAGGRGNAVVAVSYSDRGETWNNSIPFLRRGFEVGALPASATFLATGTYNPTQSANRPSQAALNAYFGQFGAAPGAVNTTQIIGFNNDGTSLFNVGGPAIYNYKNALAPRYAIDTFTSPGTATLKQNFTADTLASLPVERWSFFGRSTYEITDGISLFGQILYTHYSSVTAGGAPTAGNSWAVEIPRDGAHPVPAAFAALLDSRPNPAATWRLNKTLTFMGLGRVQHTNDVFQATAGLRGDFGNGITWEIYGAHGETQLIDKGVSGFASLARLTQLLQAPNYGQNFSNGFGKCTSGINPFGEQNGTGPNAGSYGDARLTPVSADCIDYLNPYWTNSTRIKQDIFEASTQGGLVELPAGEMRFATGVGYRRTSLDFDADKALAPDRNYLSDTAGQFGVNSVEGSDSVKEAYVELLVPLLKDLPLVQALEMDLAYRYSDYQRSGGTHTYKADLSWRVLDALRLRGGYQRAVRAPNVYEQFGPPTLVFDSAVDACQSNVTASYANVASNPNRTKVQQLCRTLMGTGAPPVLDPVNDPYGLNTYLGTGSASLNSYPRGNPNLKPEEADTFTVGAVFEPRWSLPGDGRVRLSVDYYNLTINGAIGYLGANLTYQLCFNADGKTNPTYDPNNIYCQTVGRQQDTGTGTPSGVFSLYLNQGEIKTSGVDIQGDLRFDVGPGHVGLNTIVNYLDSFTRRVGPGAPTLQYAGFNGGYFRWKTFTDLSYSVGGATLGLRWRYLSPTKTQDYLVTPCTSTRCFADTRDYNLFDLYWNVKAGKSYTLRGGVDNLFDRDPPVTRGIPGNTDPQNYDLLGRRFYVAASLRF